MPTYTNPKNDRRSLTHTGAELGSSNVTLNQNATGREDQVIAWTCPRKYETITFAAGRHWTDFTPRSKETFDGTGSKKTFALTADIYPTHGETNLNDQQYPPVVATDTNGSQLTVESYDYALDEVTFASAPSSGTDNVLIWPVITEGYLKPIGIDQFGHRIAALDEWGIPLHVFHDFNTKKRMTEVHLTGAVTWEESEELAFYIDSPRQIVWSDNDYPNGQYASSIEQRVDVDV